MLRGKKMVRYFGQFVWIQKSHYNSGVSLHEGPTKKYLTVEASNTQLTESDGLIINYIYEYVVRHHSWVASYVSLDLSGAVTCFHLRTGIFRFYSEVVVFLFQIA